MSQLPTRRGLRPANHSLERTPPRCDFDFRVARRRRSARGRWAASRGVP
jgi:hypothetical protein